MSDCNKSTFLTKSVHLITAVALLATTFCKPSELNNASDPNSKSFFENALLLCALGYYQACNSCSPAPGPWDSFVGTANSGQTQGIRIVTDKEYNSYSLFLTSSNFSGGGVGFSGTDGSTFNFMVGKKSPTGETVWNTYVGLRDDSPFDLIFRENDGLYFFFETTSSLPNQKNPFAGTIGTTPNAVLGKLSFEGQILWTTYPNNGGNGDFVRWGSVINSTDNSGLYAIGSTSDFLVGTGTTIGSFSGSNWFFQKISYEGTTLSTRFIDFPSPIDNFTPLRLQQIPDGSGFYVVAKVNADVTTALFPNPKNNYPTPVASTNMVMKLDATGAYLWHRYLGGDNPPAEELFTLANPLPEGKFLTSAVYSATSPSLGLPYPGGGIQSTIVYLLDDTGNLLNSSFVYQQLTEGLVLSKGEYYNDGKYIVSGGRLEGGNSNGFVSEFDLDTLKESIRIPKVGLATTSAVRHCDSSYSTITYSTQDIPNTILPKGSATINSYFSRFKP